MQPYNVEIFDRDFTLRQHYNVGDVKYSFDYLSTVENSVLVAFNESVQNGDYIHLSNGSRTFFGIITGIDIDKAAAGHSTIRYRPFSHIFDAPIMFDTDLQPGSGSGSTKSLEDVIADIITEYWISNDDDEQNIKGLTVKATSSTTDWGLHLTSDVQGLHKTIINFTTSIIQRAMSRYRIGVYIEPDFIKKEIAVTVGVKDNIPFVIEADLPNIIRRTVLLNETTKDNNKMVIYSNEDYESKIIYYKHPDGTYDTEDRDRIIPVVYGMTGVTPGDEHPFEEVAKESADKALDRESYNNLIEITVLNSDALVTLEADDIGKLVDVKTNNAIYPSILTGIVYESTKKLIFGTIRIELTKILKEARNG